MKRSERGFQRKGESEKAYQILMRPSIEQRGLPELHDGLSNEPIICQIEVQSPGLNQNNPENMAQSNCWVN